MKTLTRAAVSLCAVAAPVAPAAVGEAQTTLDVRIVAPDPPTGLAGVALWSSGEGFPEDIRHAVQAVYVPIADGVAHVTLDVLEPGGRYAVTVYNDKNDNGRFDKNWIGMPREPWGVSNNIRPTLRAPRFDEAVIELGPGAHSIEIHLE